VEKARRAAFLEGQLTDLKRAWSSGAVGPRPVQAGGPPLILGGQAPPAIARAAAAGTGWIAGAVGPELFRVGSKLFTTQWQALGRSGRPRLLALAYFGLGPQGPEHAEKFLRHYYASAGPFVERAVRAAAVSAERVRQVVGQFAEAGCDELLFLPCSADMDQVGLLAAALQRTPVAV